MEVTEDGGRYFTFHTDTDADSGGRTARRLRRQELHEKSLLDTDNEEERSPPVTRSSPRPDCRTAETHQPARSEQPATAEQSETEQPAAAAQLTTREEHAPVPQPAPIMVEIKIVNDKGTLSPNPSGGGGGLYHSTANPCGAGSAAPYPCGGQLAGQSSAMNSSYVSISAMKKKLSLKP